MWASVLRGKPVRSEWSVQANKITGLFSLNKQFLNELLEKGQRYIKNQYIMIN